MLEAYKKFNDGLEWLIVGFTGLLVLVIVALPFISAVVRYVTGEGYTWLAEAPPQLVPWVVFPLLGVVLRHDGHIAVDVMPHYLKGRALTLLRAAVLAACLAARSRSPSSARRRCCSSASSARCPPPRSSFRFGCSTPRIHSGLRSPPTSPWNRCCASSPESAEARHAPAAN